MKKKPFVHASHLGLPGALKIHRIVLKNLFNYLKSNNLITKNQSGFTPGVSGTNQLISLIHDIHKAFDDNRCLEVRSVYLDMSKAFDKVWYEGQIHKLVQNGIDGYLLEFFKSYLSNRKQRVVLGSAQTGHQSSQVSHRGQSLDLCYFLSILMT